jgi:calcineurin-like phosphoesterase family protein
MEHIYTKEQSKNIYFSSDLHAFHKNICLGTSVWDDKETNCRNFNTIEEMNETIVKSINSRVGKDDILYHLGDWSFGGWENIWNLRKQIICENIIQINGNHDDHIRKDKFFPHLVKQDGIICEISDENDYRILGDVKDEGDVTAKDFFKEVYDGTGNDGIEIEIDGQKIILNHYPLETWKGIADGVWLLFGHEHSKNKDSDSGKTLDLDWGRFMKPISFFEIKDIMDSREIDLKGINRSH